MNETLSELLESLGLTEEPYGIFMLISNRQTVSCQRSASCCPWNWSARVRSIFRKYSRTSRAYSASCGWRAGRNQPPISRQGGTGVQAAHSTWDFTNLSSILSHATFQPVFLVHRYTVSVIYRLLRWRAGSSQTSAPGQRLRGFASSSP